MAKTDSTVAPAALFTGKLNAKQQKFVEEFLVDLNGTQAAIRAGYSVDAAHIQATNLLRNTKVQAAVSARIKARTERTEVTQDYVLGVIVETVERCRQAKPVLDKLGRPVMIETPSGMIGAAFVFDPSAVLKGAELLGKHVGMFPTNMNIKVSDLVEHKHDFSNLTDEELEAYHKLRDKIKQREEKEVAGKRVIENGSK